MRKRRAYICRHPECWDNPCFFEERDYLAHIESHLDDGMFERMMYDKKMTELELRYGGD